MIAGRLISWAARQHGKRPALVFRDKTFSHAEVEARSNRFANALLTLGLQPGERVAVLLENSVESMDSQFGAEKAALTYVALNTRHTLQEQIEILQDAQASAVVLGAQFAEIAQSLADKIGTDMPDLRHVLLLGETSIRGQSDLQVCIAQANDNPPGLKIGPDHIMRIAYTSGTTGKPKGVAYTLQRWEDRLTNHFLAMEYGLSVDDAMLHVGPLTHAAGVYLFPCFLRGARNVILDRFDPQALLTTVEKERITHLMLVPTMLTRLVEAIEAGATGDWSSLKRIHYGTAPTPVSLIRRAIQIFGPILRQQYGMTEAVQPLTVLYPHEHIGADEQPDDNAMTSCGRPTANITITLRDSAGKEVPHGTVGEITLAHEGAAKVLLWRRDALMAELVRDGWYYTGDLGRFDDHGLLHIVGRNKDMIISGGFNVYAREVEDALESHPSIHEAAVVGLPDATWGEIVAAVVVKRENMEVGTEELIRHCAEKIASYKKPKLIVFSKRLPRNLAGKVVKSEVTDQFAKVTQ